MNRVDQTALGCITFMSVAAFLAFGLDKWRAARAGQRISEFALVAWAALGGWPGGMLGMMFFRHKVSKWTFKLKFTLALIPFAAEVWTWWRFR
ncbi:MAG: hypothetical protein RLY20_3300 [Verrucomicrobiota bacterium]|jgi:uncharacterized membrane protein YsdA (DUF1294 family)